MVNLELEWNNQKNEHKKIKTFNTNNKAETSDSNPAPEAYYPEFAET